MGDCTFQIGRDTVTPGTYGAGHGLAAENGRIRNIPFQQDVNPVESDSSSHLDLSSSPKVAALPNSANTQTNKFMARRYQISTILTAVFVDRDGNVVSFAASGKELRALLAERFAESGNDGDTATNVTPDEPETVMLSRGLKFILLP